MHGGDYVRILDNTVYRDMTEEEISEFEKNMDADINAESADYENALADLGVRFGD